MGCRPFDYLMSKQWMCYKDCNNNLYRMFVYSDFYCLMSSLYSVYERYDSLQKAIIDNGIASSDYLDALINLLPAKGIPKNKNKESVQEANRQVEEYKDNSYYDIALYDEIYLDQALELADILFDNNLDKVYFLRQYLKPFKIGNNTLEKVKQFTKVAN